MVQSDQVNKAIDRILALLQGGGFSSKISMLREGESIISIHYSKLKMKTEKALK